MHVLHRYALLAGLLGIAWLTACEGTRYKQGENLYRSYCANCHMEDGTGLERLIPPLAGSDWLRDHQDTLPCIIRNGMHGPVVVNGITYEGEMPSNKQLNAVLINNLINYINHAWGNDFGEADIRRTEAALERCQ